MRIFFTILITFFCISYVCAENIQKNTVDLTPEITQQKKDVFNYQHTFFREIKTTDEDGAENVTRETVKQTIPGEQLVGIINYQYISDQESKEFFFTLLIPQEVLYAFKTASNSKYVWVSIDNGKSWLKESDLDKKMLDRITHIQWRLSGDFKNNDTGTLEYKVIIQ